MTPIRTYPSKLLEQFSLPRFNSRKEARDFWLRNDANKYEMRRFFLYFGVIAFLAHGVLDLTAGGDLALTLFSMRIVCVVIMLALAIAFHRHATAFRPDTLINAYLGVAALTIIAMTMIVEKGTVADTYPFGLVILFAYGGTVLVPRCIKLIALITAAYLLYIASIPFSMISGEGLVVNLFFVTVGMSALGIGSLTRERLERLQMMQEHALRELANDLEFSRQEALAARDTAVEASKTQAKFITSVSHELRTPLNAIIGFSDMMINEISGPVTNPTYKTYINDIHRAGSGLLLDINDLLDVHRLSAGKMSWTDTRFSLGEMVRNAVAVCRHDSHTVDVDLISHPPEAEVDAFGDGTRVGQVVINLLTNALKFTDAGGSVTITQTLEESGDYRITVRDTGIGIPASDLSRIKDPFQQAEDGSVAKRKGGLGLGLAIVGGILDQIGGRLEISSEVNVGTTCDVFIPHDRLFIGDAPSEAATA